MTRRLAAGPREGWLSLGLVMLMCVTMAWAIDDVAPVMGRGAYTDFLTWAAVGGVLFGFIGPQVGWGRWRTYLIGAIFAALVVPLLVGGLLPQDGSLFGRFEATAGSMVIAYLDLIYYGLSFTQEYGHHLLVIGLLIWATSMFASYATFGHGRPLNAVVLIGVALIVNMSFTINDQLGYLILYSLASLFLLIRFHAMEEQAEWLRRRIGDPAAISGIYLRGGSVFIALAVVGSLLLTKTAASDPLAGAWDGVSESVIDAGRSLSKFLPGGPNSKTLSTEFTDDTQIRGFWTGGNTVDLTIQVPANEDEPLYWRAVTFDRFEGNSWTSTRPVESATLAGEVILGASLDFVPSAIATRAITFTVFPREYTGTSIVSPLVPSSVDQDATLNTLGTDQFFVALRREATTDAYTVTATIPIRNEDIEGGLEENRLRAAGTEYPQEIRDLYLAPTPIGVMGPAAEALLVDMVAAAPSGAASYPYDLAKTMERQFRRADLFAYDADVQDLPCAEERLSTVECFARYRQGYCQYYATTMAILLRELGIPSRVVDGYLPGDRNVRTGTETLLGRSRHEWVEVYFPGYGWVMFDPTGGNLTSPLEMPVGGPIPSATPRPSSSFAPGVSARPGEDGRDDAPDVVGGITRTGGGPGAGLLIVVALALAAVMGAMAFTVWRRGPRGQTSPDRAYGTVTRIASRLGFGPRPNQTVYEYAGALAEVLPESRPALETVARAKVETTYGRGILGADGLTSLREAERRLRVGLLRLFFRRDRRGPR